MFYETFCNEWMFLDKQVEHNLRVSLRRTKEHMITLNYQVIQDPVSKEKNCFVSSVEPERLGQQWDYIKDQYNIVYHPFTKKVTMIENRNLGKVVFNGIEHDN